MPRVLKLVLLFCSSVTKIATRPAGSRTGIGDRSTLLISVKMVVLAPIPSARDRAATSVNPGFLISIRNP